MADDEYFGSNAAEHEIARLNRVARQLLWNTPQNRKIQLTIPPTVYPPREDTDVLAKVILNIPNPSGKRLLEIGCGSGAISLFAAQLGFTVTACDINPYAVASSRDSSRQNNIEIEVREGGPGPESDGEIRQWAGEEPHDVIVWNLPYLVPENDSEHLGPLEEAALLDTDEKGLVARLLHQLNTSTVLADGGVVYLLVSENEKGRTARSTCLRNGFAVRKVAEHQFEDEEQLVVLGIWRPYHSNLKLFESEIDSTNSTLLASEHIEGDFLQAGRQLAGHGRRGRTWSHEDIAFAGSWVIHDRSELPNPGLIQLQAGLALYEAIYALVESTQNIVLKWPNDVLLKKDNELRKVGGVLVESVSRGKTSRIILGIGCNIHSSEVQKEGYSLGALHELNEQISLDDFQVVIQASVASWFEQKQGLEQPTNKSILSLYESKFSEAINALGSSIYRNKVMTFSTVNIDGRIALKDGEKKIHIIEDGEHIEWSNYSLN